jgi:hypothetical protein
MSNKTKTKTRRRAKPAPKKTTALAVRKPVKVAVLPPAGDDERNLTDEIMLGGLGLVELKLKPEEEEVCARGVNVHDIQVKPTGQPYLPHPVYTRWFNTAFGRLGWALVPVSKPVKAQSGKKVSVVVPYVFYIHGHPVAFANGEQDYYEDNAEQTYGDALESTVASGLRRCAKRLGIGLEMWDRRYLDAFVDTRCVRVKVRVKQRDNTEKEKWQVRLKGSEPFWNEVGRGRQQQQSTSREEPPLHDDGTRAEPAHEVAPMTGRTAGAAATVPGEQRSTHAKEGEVITQPQRQRLALIINNSDRTDIEVIEWLRRSYGLQSEKPTKDILRRDYDGICRAIEAKGPLPNGRA